MELLGPPRGLHNSFIKSDYWGEGWLKKNNPACLLKGPPDRPPTLTQGPCLTSLVIPPSELLFCAFLSEMKTFWKLISNPLDATCEEKGCPGTLPAALMTGKSVAAIPGKGVLLGLGISLVLGDPGTINSRWEDLSHPGSTWTLCMSLVYLTQTCHCFAKDSSSPFSVG